MRHKTWHPVRFTRDQSGSMAVEFAFLAPILVILFLGVADIGDALMSYRNVVQAASSTAHTVASFSRISAGLPQPTAIQIDTLKNGADLTARGRAVGSSLRVTRITRNGAGLTQAWSVATPAGTPASTISDADYLPHMRDGESLIVADLRYSRQYLFGMFDLGTLTLSGIYAAAPDP